MANPGCEDENVRRALGKANDNDEHIAKLKELIGEEPAPAAEAPSSGKVLTIGGNTPEQISKMDMEDSTRLFNENINQIADMQDWELTPFLNMDLNNLKSLFDTRARGIWAYLDNSDIMKSLSAEERTLLVDSYQWARGEKALPKDYKAYTAARNKLPPDIRDLYDSAVDAAYFSKNGRGRPMMFSKLLGDIVDGRVTARTEYYSKFFIDTDENLRSFKTGSLVWDITRYIDPRFGETANDLLDMPKSMEQFRKKGPAAWRDIARNSIDNNRVESNAILRRMNSIQDVENSSIAPKIKEKVLQARDALYYAYFWSDIEKAGVSIPKKAKAGLDKAFGTPADGPVARASIPADELAAMDEFVSGLGSVTKEYFHRATRDVHLGKTRNVTTDWETAFNTALDGRKAGDIPENEFQQILDNMKEISDAAVMKSKAARLLDMLKDVPPASGNAPRFVPENVEDMTKLLADPFATDSIEMAFRQAMGYLTPGKVQEVGRMLSSKDVDRFDAIYKGLNVDNGSDILTAERNLNLEKVSAERKAWKEAGATEEFDGAGTTGNTTKKVSQKIEEAADKDKSASQKPNDLTRTPEEKADFEKTQKELDEAIDSSKKRIEADIAKIDRDLKDIDSRLKTLGTRKGNEIEINGLEASKRSKLKQKVELQKELSGVKAEAAPSANIPPAAKTATKADIESDIKILDREIKQIDTDTSRLKKGNKKGKNDAELEELGKAKQEKLTKKAELEEKLKSAPDTSPPVDNAGAADSYPEIKDIRNRRNEIAKMSPQQFNGEVRKAAEKLIGEGRDPGPVIKEYARTLWRGSSDTPGLFDRVMLHDKQSRLTKEQAEWWKKMDRADGGYGKTNWTEYDGKMLLDIYNRVDASTKSYLLRWMFPGMIKEGVVGTIKHPLGAVRSHWKAYTLISISVGSLGFMLEEGFQAVVLFGVPFFVEGADKQGEMIADLLPTVRYMNDIWRPIKTLLDNPVIGTVFFPLKGVNYFLEQATSGTIKSKQQAFIDAGVLKPSTEICTDLLTGEKFCFAEKATKDEQIDFVIANPSVLGMYSVEFKQMILGQDAPGAVCDIDTGVCEGNIWAKRAGLTGQAALDIGVVGLLDIANRGAKESFGDFKAADDFLGDYESQQGNLLLKGLKETYAPMVQTINGTALSNASNIWPDTFKAPGATVPLAGTTATTVAQGDESIRNIFPIVQTGALTAVSAPIAVPDTAINRAIAAMSANELVSSCAAFGTGSASQGQCAEFLNQASFMRDGTVDIAALKAFKPDLTYQQIASLYGSSNPAYTNGLKALVAANGITFVKDLIDQGVITGDKAINIVPDDKRKEFETYNTDPRNFDPIITGDGLSWNDLTGYQQRENMIKDGKVYNPASGTWDTQIPAIRDDPVTGASFKLDTNKYAAFLSQNGLKNVSQAQLQQFLATDPWICTYKCDQGSSGTTSKYTKSYTPYKSSGYSYGSYGSSSTKKTGILIHANDLRAEVYENGQYVGNTDEEIIMSSGYHTLTIKKDGYQDRTIKVNIYNNSMYNKYVTLVKSDSNEEYGICAFIEDIETENLTTDHLMYVYARYREWDSLAASALERCDPPSTSLPSNVTYNDVMYVYKLLMGQEAAAAKMIEDGKVCGE